jgi:4a-hydroxytetrahydrobiopterin dehydratase
MATPLAARTCRPLPTGTPPLSPDQIKAFLSDVPDWEVESGKLTRTFSFKNYHATVAFFNATVWISNVQDHHPDVLLTYNKLTMTYSTHTVGGLSENDFICAAKVSALQ